MTQPYDLTAAQAAAEIAARRLSAVELMRSLLGRAEALERLKPLPAPAPGAEPSGQAAPDAGPQGDPVRGQQLFFINGCNVCHGDQGEGGIGLPIAGTALPLEEVISQYRNPRDQMPVFPPDVIPDEDIADTYAWLQTLPSQ